MMVLSWGSPTVPWAHGQTARAARAARASGSSPPWQFLVRNCARSGQMASREGCMSWKAAFVEKCGRREFTQMSKSILQVSCPWAGQSLPIWMSPRNQWPGLSSKSWLVGCHADAITGANCPGNMFVQLFLPLMHIAQHSRHLLPNVPKYPKNSTG